MKRLSPSLLALLGSISMAAATDVRADNLLGLYVGAGVGTAAVQNKNEFYDPVGFPGTYHDHDAAWMVIAGVRPIPFVGAEVQYVDFGNAGGNSGVYHGTYDSSISSHPKAAVLYGVGYLPLPLPFLDVYAKLGAARLETNNTYLATSLCPGSSCPEIQTRFDKQNTKFAYGAGVQAKIQDFAFRGEYERISSTYGDPSAFMASLTWTF